MVKSAPTALIGREDDLKILNDAWRKVRRNVKARPRVVTFVAPGGAGKTSLVAAWLVQLEQNGWPKCEAAYAWSFYDQGALTASASSSGLFLNEALRFFGDPETAASARGEVDKARRLAELVGSRRTLLVLDGVEPLQAPPGPPTNGKFKDPGLAALLTRLAGRSAGLCVVTTRYPFEDLTGYESSTVQKHELPKLSTAAGIELLRSFAVHGAPDEFVKLVNGVQHHALTLHLLGSYLRDVYAGDIGQSYRVNLEQADAEELGGHAFRVLGSYEASLAGGG